MGCALITAPVKLVGSATGAVVKTSGAVVSGTAHAAGNIGSDDNDPKD